MARPTQSADVHLIRWAHVEGFLGHLREIGTPVTTHLNREGLPALCEDLTLVKAYLSEGYPSSAKIASMLNISRRTLVRRLLEQGTCFSAVVDEVRFSTAKELLRSTQLKISEISVATGFEDHPHFTRMFRRIGGITPIQFRRANTH